MILREKRVPPSRTPPLPGAAECFVLNNLQSNYAETKREIEKIVSQFQLKRGNFKSYSKNDEDGIAKS